MKNLIKNLLISISLLSTLVCAQENSYSSHSSRTNPTAILESEISNIRSSNAQLGGRIKTAREKLDEVAKLTAEDEKEVQVDKLFLTLREEIYGVLDQLDSNGKFADALNQAKEGTIVLKSWYERQPPDYTNRDQSIAQLDGAIREYDVLDKQLTESRNLAMHKLSTLIRQHRVIIQQMKIGKVLEAISAARAVVEGLNDITKAMTVVEEKTDKSLKIPVPVSN